MSQQKLFFSIHNNIERKEGRKLSHKEIANRLHCSKSTYDKYLNGKLNPKAIDNLMNLLSMMSDEDIIKAIRLYKKEKE